MHEFKEINFSKKNRQTQNDLKVCLRSETTFKVAFLYICLLSKLLSIIIYKYKSFIFIGSLILFSLSPFGFLPYENLNRLAVIKVAYANF